MDKTIKTNIYIWIAITIIIILMAFIEHISIIVFENNQKYQEQIIDSIIDKLEDQARLNKIIISKLHFKRDNNHGNHKKITRNN